MMNPRFLCDEMLGHLCLYLRAAGYDALLARHGARDADLLRQCQDEGRHFLTKDTLIREHKAAKGIALILPDESLDKLALLISESFQTDWLKDAFTRCLVDNALLIKASEAATARAPADALKPGDPLFECPRCGRVYWRGSHYYRMRARLEAWQNTNTSGNPQSAGDV
jgi:uncharacterized protein with PIN domain